MKSDRPIWFARVGANVVLLLPQTVLQDVVVGGFDLPARFRGVLPADFVGVRFALGLAVALVQLDSLAAVGIVESSGELDVNLRFAIDFPVAQQPG